MQLGTARFLCKTNEKMQKKWHTYRSAAAQAQQAGNYCNAEAMWLLSLDEAKSFGNADPALIQTLAALAEVYWNQAKYRQAEPFAKQLVEVLEIVHGPDHLKVGSAAGDLAMLYHWQGKYGQAEPLYKRALAIKKKLLGDNHPEVVELIEDYANLMQSTNRPEQAQDLNYSIQQLGSQAISSNPGRRKTLFQFEIPETEENHSDGNSRKESAAIIVDDSIVERAVKALSDEHHEQVLNTHRNWEMCKSAAEQAIQDRNFTDAEKMWCRALVEAERLGPRDWRLPYTLDNLAEVWSQQDKYHVAEPLLKRSLRLKADTLGPVNQTIANALNQLAKLHYLQGHYAECELLAKKSLHMFEEVVGLEHEDVATAAHNLATLYHVQGRYEEAEPYYLRSIELRKRLLGDSNPETAKSMRNYASLLLVTQRENEAQNLNAQATGLISGNWKAINLETEQLLESKTAS